MAKSTNQNKFCPAILECEECMWWREFRHKHSETGQVEYFHRCGIEVLLEWVLRAENSIDGMQKAVNEARNRSVETKNAVGNLAHATLECFEKMNKQIKYINAIQIEE